MLPTNSVRAIIRNMSKFDLAVITFSFAVSVTYIVSHLYWGTIGGIVGIVLAAALFIFGQLFIALRGANSRYKESITWEKNVLPTLSVVRRSLESNLVLLSNSPGREFAYKNERRDYINREGKPYRDSFRWFLNSIAPRDFVSEQSSNNTLPLISRVKSLRDNLLIPTRDLLRWGLLMNRLYEEGEPDNPAQLFGQSVLEMVSSLYLIECERFLTYLEHSSSVRRMPRGLEGENIEFAGIEYKQKAQKTNYQFVITGHYQVSDAADTLIFNLNSISDLGYDLARYSSIPDFPVVGDGYIESADFCSRYLTVAWYRSVLTHWGWILVRPADRQSASVS